MKKNIRKMIDKKVIVNGATERSIFFDSTNLVGNFKFLSGEDGLDLRVTRDLLIKLENDHSRNLNDEDMGILKILIESICINGKLPYNWSPQESHFLDTHDTKDWLNYLIYRYKFKLYPKKRIVSDFPIYALIEPTSICNLRCVMCYQSDDTFTKKNYMGMMDFQLFKRAVDELVEGGCRALTLAARGEPLLHDQFIDFINYASGKFYELKVNTNAMLLNENISRAILESGVNELVFSIDSHTKGVYERIRILGKFDQVHENIKKFHEIRQKFYPSSKVKTRVSGMLFDPEQDELQFKDYWTNIVDEVGYAFVRPQWDTYSNPEHPDNTEACQNLWGRIYVWWDGIVNPCEQDYKSTLSPGRFPEKSLREIWHSKNISELRAKHNKGERNKCYPCDRCGWSSKA